jgi:ubiquinone/menaquinone biosynthesis C-methylase UbiE
VYTSSDAWAAGPARIYDRLAEALVARSPESLDGVTVLDLGAGTGAASRAVSAVGGSPIALDLSVEMLRHDRERRPPATLGDAYALPVRDDGVGAVIAACSISHVPDPEAALREVVRVTRAGGPVLVSVFSSRSGHPAKEQVDTVATRFGYEPPRWYEDFKANIEPLTASIDALFDVARRAGFADAVVVERPVDVGVRDPETLVAWRTGLAQLSPFVDGLDADRRAALLEECRVAVGDDPPPLVPLLLFLTAPAP